VSFEQRGVALQVQRPTGLVVDSLPDGLPSVAVAIEIAVLQLYPRALGRFDEEPHFDLAGEISVGLDLPLRADVPAEDDAVRGLEDKDPRPSTLAPVHRAIVDVAADSRLEHGLGDRSLEQVVARRISVKVSGVDEVGSAPLRWLSAFVPPTELLDANTEWKAPSAANATAQCRPTVGFGEQVSALRKNPR
jgi:hypothetical protein